MRQVNPDDGTNLYEFWQLEDYNWADGREALDDPVVKCYVAHWQGTHDTGKDGLPFSDERAVDTASWSETPEEIQDAFFEEVNKMNQALAQFE